MITFEVPDMTCGHCAGTITRALKSADPGARVAIDLARHRVTVEPTEADARELREAIAEAGYNPVPVTVPVPVTAPEPAAAGRAAGCCGSCR